MRRLALVASIVAVLLLAAPVTASAHPLGNFTINHYTGLAIRPDSIWVDYVLDMAEIPAFQEQRSIDADGDRTISEAEASRYRAAQCESLAVGLDVRLGSSPLPLQIWDSVLAFPPGQAGLDTLRLECTYRIELPESTGILTVANANYASRIGWREMTVRSNGVAVETNLPAASISDRLSSYPQDLLASPLEVESARLILNGANGEGLGAFEDTPVSAAPARSGRPVDAFASLIARGDLGVGSAALAILAAFALGIGHALAPGHGKTVMAAYLVGNRGTVRQALVLGAAVAISHTVGVAVLGIVTLAASTAFEPERVYPYVSTLAGAIVLGIGLWLVAQRIRHRLAHRRGYHHHRRHGLFHRHLHAGDLPQDRPLG
ncbi:MAG: nickel transporter, partial [Acidimicrobiia bacterium]